jgi:hypothetical protein
MRQGKVHHVPANLTTDEEYEPFLFSFEEMMRAELKQLRQCLGYYQYNATADGTDENRHHVAGFGADKTEQKWRSQTWARRMMAQYGTIYEHASLQSTDETRMPPPELIDLDGVCYGRANYKPGILREQWEDLVDANPDKIILRSNAFLTSTLLGRSLYVLPLEWWYLRFERTDLYFMCTEELSDPTGDPLNELSVNFLGLPRYDNYSAVVAEGAYNVGGHRGYDTATAWDAVNEEQEPENADNGSADSNSNAQDAPASSSASSSASSGKDDDLPLPTELHRELLDFVRPYNERLFALTGRRCKWAE